MKRLILFLIRQKLGVKKYEYFRFYNQKKDCVYFFTDTCLRKMYNHSTVAMYSNISLNWLLDDKCKILKRGDENKRS